VLLAGAMAIAPASIRGQEVIGEVRHARHGGPVAQALVAWLGRPASGVLTSAEGRFRIRGVEPSLVVMAIGYRPDTIVVTPGVPALIRLEPAPLTLAPLVVAAARAASPRIGETVARHLDFLLEAPQSSQELLRKAPGLVIAQHGGGAKAEQIFLRGFDADHGTDVAVSVDDVPVNLVSHAHGQGYADLHFLIPELVERIEVSKGGHDPRDGNLATAGAVRFVTRDRVEGGSAWSRGGSFDSYGAGALVPFGRDRSSPGGYLALTAQRSDGPFEHPQAHRRANGYAKFTAPIGAGAEAFASLSGYRAVWAASGQIPDRAVQSGLIGRFGAIDPTEGGSTRRADVILGVRSRGPADEGWQLQGFVSAYRLDLYSNFTFFLNDSLAGDGIAQFDDRTVLGASGRWSRPTGIGHLAAGFGLRADLASVVLANQTARRLRDTRLASQISEQNAGLWVRQEIAFAGRGTLGLGLRADLFRFSVTDQTVRRGGLAGGPSGGEWAARISPKLAVDLPVGSGVTLQGGLSTAFHSNDARDVVLAGDSVETLPRAVTAEVGLTKGWSNGSLGLGLWRTDLASELVFVGDEGVTEPSGRTRRVGVDLDARWRLLSWLFGEASLNLVRGRLRDEPIGADRIPLAPSRTASLGLVARGTGPLAGAIEVRHLGDRPADEQGTVVATGATIASMSLSWRLGRLAVGLEVENLFDTPWREAQFATTSRLRGERDPVTELHYTPGNPRQVELRVQVSW